MYDFAFYRAGGEREEVCRREGGGGLERLLAGGDLGDKNNNLLRYITIFFLK